jgi:cAMP-dependent protein kinase regulator
VRQYKAGDFFGELALLKNAPRAASIFAKSELKLASIDRDSFKRLLGPLDNILKRNISSYLNYMQ